MIRAYHNFLAETLIADILAFKAEAIFNRSAEWYTNQTWDDDLKRGSGAVGVLPIADYTSAIKAAFVDVDSAYGTYALTSQLYIWMPGSYIPWHNDPHKDLAATIYLNESWDANDGGIFLYQDDQGAIHGELPEFNKAVINVGQVNHHVSMIPPESRQQRVTIQVWGTKQD